MRFFPSEILIVPALALLVAGLNIPEPGLLARVNATSSSTSAATDVASASATASGAAASSTSASNAGNSADPQSSLTLDPNVIAKGFENNGLDQQGAGQVASLTSSNNFINFCLTVPNLPITNGQQIAGGSCNPAPMGVIPSSANMPSAKFTNPKNLDAIPANKTFTVSLAIQGMETGFFVNAQENYFAAPQQLNAQGQIQGHSHVVIEQLDSLTQTTPTDPTKFAFFKGLNNAAQNGVLTADVPGGLPEGAYKMSTINSASNHQPVLAPVAQHGSLDDAVYFTVKNDGSGGDQNEQGPGRNSDRRRFLSRIGMGLH
ncbi:hypothetical protein F5I97DRAFT_2046250 [Phlebopus sp. FC_14]|nr:hypothetical protein F5I97DRAFT_2046250 [Phlebopus sp. FC_14]